MVITLVSLLVTAFIFIVGGVIGDSLSRYLSNKLR